MLGLLAMGQGGCGAGQHGGQGSSAAPRRAAGAPGLAQEQPAACAGVESTVNELNSFEMFLSKV